MMDVLEAIKGLDGYAEALVSLSTLLGSKVFEEKSEEYESLLAQIREKQRDGKWLAGEIMKDIHHVGTKADRSGDMTGLSAAIQRHVAADNQASEALKKKDQATTLSPSAEAIRKFRESQGFISK
jgi:hypothetical protein